MMDLKAIQQLDLNLLKVFSSLYEQQNMTRTAEALNLTPSAVSHAIRRLRDALDDPLFVRDKQRMIPTPACQHMAPMIIDNLSRLRQILQQWGAFEPSTSRHHFHIGLHDALEPAVLPRLQADLLHHAPNVTVSSIKVERGQMARALASGQVDVVLDVAMPLDPPVHHQPLLDDQFCVLMARDNPNVNELTRERYFEASHISVSNRPSGPSVEDYALLQQGLSRHIAWRCQSYYAAKAMVAQSALMLTLPHMMADQLADDRVVIAPLPVTVPPISTHIYWHQHSSQDAAQQWLRERLIEVLSPQDIR
ncbi:LysR family transcriptional regulator [Aestuariibacter halophilus]|uniref:LysR family transcriptional regulator n=1 Tax=Fluctibacter halophilus TaxID=226011 RepID=A0ABS8GCP4_9ALTE|nr:LysR family transcriptional regulator [Aestuariibacter halophilus]